MTIPEPSIEAAMKHLPGIPEGEEDKHLMALTTQKMLEAAMPAIRKQIAEEIREADILNDYVEYFPNFQDYLAIEALQEDIIYQVVKGQYK